MANTDIIIHDEKDNVGVVVIEKITPNQDCNCWIMENDKSAKIQSKSEIPLGHKIAMIDLKEGDTILKYGHDIGLSCAFRQPNADSHCKYIHGYSLSFNFVFTCLHLDENNWVVDFGSLKSLKNWLQETFDNLF